MIVSRLCHAGILPIAAILLYVHPAFAIPIQVNLSSPDNLAALTPGQVVTIDVSVAGIDPGDSLNALSADVLLPDSVFALPPLPTPGAAVPDPVGFLPVSLNLPPNRSVSGAYDDSLATVPPDPIITNDIFFTFAATVTGTGSGLIDFSAAAPPQVFGFDAGAGLILDVTAGGPLSFTSTPPGGPIVPEPAALHLAVFALVWLGIVKGWRRRRK